MARLEPEGRRGLRAGARHRSGRRRRSRRSARRAGRAARRDADPQVGALLATRRARVHDLRQVVAPARARGPADQLRREPADDRGDRRLPRRERAPRHLRRRALLRRLPRGPRVRDGDALGRGARRRRGRSSSATPTAGRFRGRSSSASRAVVAALGRRSASTRTTTRGARVANSIAAVRAGATHVQGTINGYGERCGNANLCSIVPNLELKMAQALPSRGGAARSSRTSPGRSPRSRTWRPTRTRPTSAGARSRTREACTSRRSAGTRAPTSTSIPALVGNRTRVVVSELSGRGNVLAKAEEYDVDARGGRDLGGARATSRSARRAASRSRRRRRRSRS